MTGFPSVDGLDAWIDAGRQVGLSHELMLGMSPALARGMRAAFWLEFSAPDGRLIGWVRFEPLLNVRNQAVFSAVELRSAECPAPPPQDVWLRSSRLPQAARADDR
jgi:hypothetical protein